MKLTNLNMNPQVAAFLAYLEATQDQGKCASRFYENRDLGSAALDSSIKPLFYTNDNGHTSNGFVLTLRIQYRDQDRKTIYLHTTVLEHYTGDGLVLTEVQSDKTATSYFTEVDIDHNTDPREDRVADFASGDFGNAAQWIWERLESMEYHCWNRDELPTENLQPRS